MTGEIIVAALTMIGSLTVFAPRVAPDRPDGFTSPIGIECGPRGQVWVVEDEGHRIIELDRDGRFRRVIGSQGSGPGQLQYPDAVRLGPDGLLYVADTGGNRIQVWREDGTYVREFGRYRSPGPQAWRKTVLVSSGVLLLVSVVIFLVAGRRVGPVVPSVLFWAAIGGLLTVGAANVFSPRVLKNPRDLIVFRDGVPAILVADFNSNAIRRFTSDGRPDESIGPRVDAKASEVDEFDLQRPLGLASDGNDRVFATELGSHRVIVFDRWARFVQAFGKRGNREGEFESPHGLAVSRGGLLFVADRGNKRVQVFKGDGEFVEAITAGPAGLIGSFAPAGLCFTPEGELLIVDTEGKRILRWSSS